jgi:ABC-type nitrate/sulfonate/bicarbonate transport system substrate-binding protein
VLWLGRWSTWRDINFVIHPPAEAMQLLADGKIDALMGFPPDPQELREKKIGPCDRQQRA